MSEKSCVGIDIGNSSVKIAVKVRGVLKNVLYETLPDDIMKEGHIVSYDAMGDFLREVMKKGKVSQKNAYVCLPISGVYIRSVVMPMMTIQQLKVNLPYEFHDFITEDMDKYVYDYAVLPPKEEEPESLNLLTVACSRETVNQYQQMAKRAKLKLKGIAPANVAIDNLFISYCRKHELVKEERDFAILDMGDSALKIHFFTKGVYEVTRTMDDGIYEIISQAAEENGTDIHIARLNVEANNEDIQRREALMDIYSGIAASIMRTLNFYNFNNRNNNIEELFYFGGGSMIQPLLEAIGQNLMIPMTPATELLPQNMKGDQELLLKAMQAVGIIL